MTNIDLGIKLAELHPQFRNASNEQQLKAILSLTDGITDQQRQAVWENYYNHKVSATMPTRPLIGKILEELKIYVRGRAGRADSYPMYRCLNNCNAEYAISKIRCPRCGNADKSLIAVFIVQGEPPKDSQQELIKVDFSDSRDLFHRKHNQAAVAR